VTVTTRLCRAVAPCLLAGALGACRDLTLPDVSADGGVGPDLTVLSPREGQTIPLNAPVNIDAVSVNGVASVTVTCGGAPSTGVFTWNVSPYTGVVDFTRCSLVTTGGTDAGFGQLQLTFIAVDRLGHSSFKSFNVLLDTTTAALSAVLPERVVPLAPLQLTVGSDRPLLLPPTVRLAGREADGVLQRANPDGGAPFYDVTFLRTPGLGIDNWGGDPFNVPFEVLTDVEHQVSLTVDANATNGNASHLEQNVLLSRVLWSRSVPGRIAVAAADPVATPVGVQVPLATRDAVPGPTAPWLPGFFRSTDGTYVPFDSQSIRVVGSSLPPDPVAADAGVPFPVDGGYFAVDLDGRGRVLMARPGVQGNSDVIALGEPSGSTRAGASYAVPFPLVAPLPDGGVFGQILTRIDDLVCLPDAFTGSQDGCWYAIPTATQTLTCFSLVDGTQTAAVGTSSSLALGPPTPGGTAGAHGKERTYLAPNDVSTSCGPVWSFLALPGSLFVPQDRLADAQFGVGCYAGSFGSPVRLLPFLDGSFAVVFDVDCPSGTGWEVVKVSSNGAVTGSFMAPQGVFLPDPVLATPPLVLAATSDGNVVTMRNDPPNTVFESWPPDGTGPSATARIPGLYVYAGSPTPRLPRNVMPASDGSLTLLLNGATLGDVVLHFGPGLKPRFLYRYPLLAQSSTLAAADGEPTVYYVDPLNNALLAIDRRGASGGSSSCVVAGVSVAANPTTIAAGGTASLTATVTASGPCSTAVSWSTTGGTLSPDGNSAAFSSATAGTFTITATSVADPSRSASATVTVTGAASCGPATGAVVTHATNISASETWAGNGVTHAVPNNISINSPATVTIQPCAIVSLGAGVSINVTAGASLVAAGTGPAGSISFVPANATQPWGILFATTATSLIDLSWTTLKGAGAFGGTYGNPAIAAAGPGYSIAPAVPVLRVNNVTIDSPQGGGVYLDTSAAFTSDSTGLTIQGAPGYAMSMVMMALGSVPPGSYSAPSNGNPVVNVIGPNTNVIADLTVRAALPVRIQTASFNVHAPPSGGTAPVTLTIEAGAVLRFPKVSPTSPGARVYFGSVGNPPNDLVGVLNAQGTAAQPILFTSGESAPAAGDWAGLYLLAATGSRLDHVTVEYAGAFSGISSANCRPSATPDDAALIIGDATQYVPPASLLTNSTVRYSAGYGIDAVWQAPTVNAPDLTQGNVFQSNARCSQTFNGLVTGACGTNVGCTAP
jgi:hypothetical protein